MGMRSALKAGVFDNGGFPKCLFPFFASDMAGP